MGLGVPGLWAAFRLPASYNGVPFVLLENRLRRGRQVALHTYPFRDDPWPEDLGRSPRITSLRGFVLGDDCDAQIQALTLAVQQPGPGQLVHPTLGTQSVTVLDYAAADDPERGRQWSFEMTVVPYVARIYPVTVADTQGRTRSLFGGIATAVTTDLQAATAFVSRNLQAAAEVINTVQTYVGFATGLVGSATSLANVAVAIAGNFGRFAGGSIATDASLAAPNTVADAVIAWSANAAAATASGAVIEQSAADVAGNAAVLPNQVQGLTEQVRTGCSDPVGAITALTSLVALPLAATLQPAVLPAQAAIAGMVRAVALASLANACADYQPSSSTEAQSAITNVSSLFDAVIVAAADAGQDASYRALRQLRQTVVADLRARSAALPALVTVTLPPGQPSLAMAYRLYGDVRREPDMVRRANVRHPGFMPPQFEAVAA